MSHAVTAPTVVVEVRVPVLPYAGRSYRAGRRLLMPVTDARRLAERGCVALLEDIDDGGDAPTRSGGTDMRKRPPSAGQLRAQYPVRVAKLTDPYGARLGQRGVLCDICRPDGHLVEIALGVRNQVEGAAAQHAATHGLPWPPEDHPDHPVPERPARG